MADRRIQIAEASLQIVAEDGVRALTHRTVDKVAGLPTGTTSNYYNSRTELVTAVAAHCEQVDLKLLTNTELPDTLDELVVVLARFVKQMIGPHRSLTRARLALYVDTPESFRDGHRRLRGMLAKQLRKHGFDDTARLAAAVSDYLDGVMLHGVTVRSAAGIRTADIVGSVHRILGSFPREAVGFSAYDCRS